MTPDDVDRDTVRGPVRRRARRRRGRAVVRRGPRARRADTETFVALRAEVQNWRWAGVPFYLRTGKRMDRRLSEIVVVFKEPPHAMFPHSEGVTEPNRLHIQLQPDEGMRLHLTAKEPGPGGIRLRPVSLDLSYATDVRPGLARRLRAAADGRHQGQPDPVHAPRRGRGRLDVGRADPHAGGQRRPTARSATRPAPPAPPPPPCSSSATAAPGRSTTNEPYPPRRRRRHRPHRRAQQRQPSGVPPPHPRRRRHGPGPRPAGLRQPRARLRRLRRSPTSRRCAAAPSPTSRSCRATTTCSRRTSRSRPTRASSRRP